MLLLTPSCVFKDSTTIKLRVVFDASSKFPNGYCLNNCLLLGPRLQDDVFDILICFGLHQYALSADVAKMYRQVTSDASDCDFHRILWRDYVTDEIQELIMTRVTYGMSSSFYLSTRALQGSGKTNGPNPNTVDVILNDFWVDDLLSGADTLEEACVLQDDLIETLNKNCLSQCKWSNNEPLLVTSLPKDLQEAGKTYEIDDKSHQIKTLEPTWHPLEDHFVYTSSGEYVSIVSKRTSLSDASKHFDPIGLIAPVRAGNWILSGTMQVQAMCHGHTQTRKMAWTRCHSSRYPRRCYQPTCTLKPHCKPSVMLPQKPTVLVFIWRQSKVALSLQPSFPPKTRWHQSSH